MRTVTLNDYEAMKRHERMKQAFLAIGTSQASGNKYVEVWHVFESAAKKSQLKQRSSWIDIVTDVAEWLKTTRTFE